MKLSHIYYPLIQNKYLTLQTGCMLIIIIINTGHTAYADEPRGQSTPQEELNNIHTQTIINRLGYIVC